MLFNSHVRVFNREFSAFYLIIFTLFCGNDEFMQIPFNLRSITAWPVEYRGSKMLPLSGTTLKDWKKLQLLAISIVVTRTQCWGCDLEGASPGDAQGLLFGFHSEIIPEVAPEIIQDAIYQTQIGKMYMENATLWPWCTLWSPRPPVERPTTKRTNCP